MVIPELFVRDDIAMNNGIAYGAEPWPGVHSSKSGSWLRYLPLALEQRR
jgi:hypothetical protein